MKIDDQNPESKIDSNTDKIDQGPDQSSSLNRRQFIGGILASGAAAVALGMYLKDIRIQESPSGTPLGPDAYRGPANSNFMSPDERKILAEYCELMFRGSAALGAVMYIETLLTAFDSNPPKIYARGGSLGANTSDEFLPLTRDQEYAWRLRLYGSDGMPKGGPNDAVLGKTKGLRNEIKNGLANALISIQQFEIDSERNTRRNVLLNAVTDDFKDVVQTMTLHGVFGQPVYGGNRDMGGWKLAHFPGDATGFSYYDEDTKTNVDVDKNMPVSSIDPGKDPQPISFASEMYLKLIAGIQGRNFK